VEQQPHRLHPGVAGQPVIAWFSTFLSLAYNHLEGTIPPGLGSIPGLQYLALAYNNLSGEPPVSLYNLSSLGMLQIQGNMLHGGIPADIGTKFPSIFFSLALV
jgi:hypothetical protein